MAGKKTIDQQDVILKGPLAELFPKVSFAVGGIGLLASVFMAISDSHHFYYSYLVAFCFFMTLTLGSMFFVLMQHISRAGWSVAVRRIPETLMQNVPLMLVFFLPIIIGAHDLYHWTHLEDVAKDHLLQVKYPYLNMTFFVIRAAVFFGAWIWIARKFYNYSIQQDESGDGTLTLNLQRVATFSIIIFGLTLTFAFIDWVMSITPHWYSTIFGVYFFAGSMVVAFAALGLIMMLLRRYGYLRDVVTLEHFQDIGKFLYGFNIFWSYIAFSQYFLIWYANVPEETVWFAEHFHGSWNTVAAVLAIGHFGIPFVIFMSRHAKRNLKFHAAVATWLVFMHIVDLYWIIMPNVSKTGIHVTLMDIVPFIGIGGIYFGVFLNRLKSKALVPIKDPRLDESLSFHNH